MASCSIWPELMVVTPGALARFHVLANDASGAPVVISAGASWQAMGAIIGAPRGHSVEVVASTTPTLQPVSAVRASFGATHCEARWLVLPSPGMGELLAVVVEEGSGLPIPGATVVLSGADGGTVEQQVSDLSGVARLTAVDSTSTLSVFHADFSYQTIANLTGKSRPVFFALRRSRADRHGGYVGSFPDVPQTSNIHLARAGLSSPADRLELTDELEPTVPTDTRTGSLGGAQTAVPVATFMSYGDAQFKPTVTVSGESGRCAETSATASGTCSVQSAWALTGQFAPGDFPLELRDEASLVDLLWRLRPARGLSSTVLRDLDLRFHPAPVGAGGFPNLRDTTRHSAVELAFSQVRVGFHFAAKAPRIPRSDGGTLRNAIASGVALVPGRGMVPLGFGVGQDTSPPDWQLDRAEPFGTGVIALHMAPPHHGLEGQPTAMVLQVYEPASRNRGRASTTLVAPLPPRLPFDLMAQAPIDLSGHAFPELVQGEFSASTRRFDAAPVAGMSLVRVTFTDGLEAEWDVLVDPAAPSFTLPPVPGTLRDRIFRDGNGLSGEAAQRKVTALRLADARPFDEVIGENAAARSPGALTGWSQVEAMLPGVVFTSTPAVLRDQDSLELKTFGFDVVRRGRVKVTFEGGAGCSEVTLTSEPLRFTPNASCRGPSVVVRAELLERDGSPLMPPVTTSFTTAIE